MSEARVLVDRPVPEVAVVTLNRPERMNSMAFDVMVPLLESLRELRADNAVRAVVLTGAGRGFCSGADQSGERGRIPHVDGLTQPSVALRAMDARDVLARLEAVERVLKLRQEEQKAIEKFQKDRRR